MKEHVRYTWNVSVVAIDEAQAALNDATLGAQEVYAVYHVTGATGETAATSLAIITRQSAEAKKAFDDAGKPGIPVSPEGIDYLSREDSLAVERIVDGLNSQLMGKGNLGSARYDIVSDTKKDVYTEVIRRFLRAGWKAGRIDGMDRKNQLFVEHPKDDVAGT